MRISRIQKTGVLFTFFFVSMTGCRPAPPPPKTIQPYDTTLWPIEWVVTDLAVRTNAVRTIWSRLDFSISITDQSGKIQNIDGDGVLMLRKPQRSEPRTTPTEFKLTGNKDILGQIFEVGSNRQVAWVSLKGDIDTSYWFIQGEPVDPRKLPARPDLLADVLGIADWSDELTAFPAPVMRFDVESDSYVLTVIEKPLGESHLVTRREVWVNKSDMRPRRVLVYAENGQLAIESSISSWVSIPGRPGAQVPTDVVIRFPMSGMTMRLTLRNPLSERNGFPKDISFRMPGEFPTSKVISLTRLKGM